jgi:hypothetical protein
MKRKTSFKIVVTLAIILFVFGFPTLRFWFRNMRATIDNNVMVADDEHTLIATQPDEFLVVDKIIDDTIQDKDVIDDETDNIKDNIIDNIIEEDVTVTYPNSAKFSIVETYANSQADGGGSMLWMLNVSYDGSNASNLLADKGLYLVQKTLYGDENSSSEKWFSLSHAFYLDEEEGFNSTGYLNGYAHSVQFAVVNIAPDDVEFGTYSEGLLTADNFVGISHVYFNLYFGAAAFSCAA